MQSFKSIEATSNESSLPSPCLAVCDYGIAWTVPVLNDEKQDQFLLILPSAAWDLFSMKRVIGAHGAVTIGLAWSEKT